MHNLGEGQQEGPCTRQHTETLAKQDGPMCLQIAEASKSLILGYFCVLNASNVSIRICTCGAGRAHMGLQRPCRLNAPLARLKSRQALPHA